MDASREPGSRRRMLLLGAAALTIACGAAHAAEPLTGEAIRALVSGNTLRGSFLAKQLTIAFYEDGTLVGTMGLSGSDRGEWTIRDDLYCQHWVRYFGAEERCYEWVPQGGGYLVRNADAFRTYDFQGTISKGFPPGF